MSFFFQILVKKIYRLQDKKQSLQNPRSSVKDFLSIGVFACKNALRSYTRKPAQKGCLTLGIIFSGGFGDQIIQSQWTRVFLQSLIDQNYDFHTTLIVDNPHSIIHKYLTSPLPHIDQITTTSTIKHTKFDVLVDLFAFLKIIEINAKAVKKYAPNLLPKLEYAFKLYQSMQPIQSIHNYYQVMNLAIAKGWNGYDLQGSNGLCPFDRHTKPILSMEPAIIEDTLKKFNLQNKKFITLHSGVGQISNSKTLSEEEKQQQRNHATRLLPPATIEKLFALLKQKYPESILIQVGEPGSTIFAGSDLCLIGKTSFEESLALVAAAAVHIDNDSGLVHFRHALQKRSVVAWGPTDSRFTGYDEDFHVHGNCSPCMWLTLDWNTVCPKGYSCAQCMHSIEAESLLSAVEQCLKAPPLS